ESETYECGIDLTYASANLSFTYFYTDFDDKIQVDILPSSVQTYKNIGGATIEGFEGEISFDIGDFFGLDFDIRPYGSIVYLTEYEDDETHEDLTYTEDINASWGIIFSDMKGLSANLNFAYTGEKDIEDYENYVWGEPVKVIERGGFTVANFTVSKKILDFDKYGTVTLKGRILNLFDKDYDYVKGYPMPGRNFFIGMRYDY
ncbi:MAG: TonB-dependent receptor, partial [Desulfobacterales bacterium]